METVLQTVGDGSLSDEQLGAITRKVHEIYRRLRDGAITVGFVLTGLQKVIDGPLPPPPPFVPKPYSPPTYEFERPNRKERRRSLAPYKTRLPHSLQRLDFPQRCREHLMAEMWEAENIPHRGIDYGAVPVNAILDQHKDVSERDVEVIASTLQWLATNCGNAFLLKYVESAGLGPQIRR